MKWPNQKKRLTSSRSGKRRSHLRAKKTNLASCPKCHEANPSHHVCYNCGYFRGRDVLKIAEKTKLKEARRKAREEKEKEEKK